MYFAAISLERFYVLAPEVVDSEIVKVSLGLAYAVQSRCESWSWPDQFLVGVEVISEPDNRAPVDDLRRREIQVGEIAGLQTLNEVGLYP